MDGGQASRRRTWLGLSCLLHAAGALDIQGLFGGSRVPPERVVNVGTVSGLPPATGDGTPFGPYPFMSEGAQIRRARRCNLEVQANTEWPGETAEESMKAWPYQQQPRPLTCWPLISKHTKTAKNDVPQPYSQDPLEYFDSCLTAPNGSAFVLYIIKDFQVNGLTLAKAAEEEEETDNDAKTKAVDACRATCYATFFCELWQYVPKSGCYIQDRRDQVPYPLMESDGIQQLDSTEPLLTVEGELVQRFCPLAGNSTPLAVRAPRSGPNARAAADHPDELYYDLQTWRVVQGDFVAKGQVMAEMNSKHDGVFVVESPVQGYVVGLAAMPGDRVYPDGMIAQLSAAAKESSMRLLLKGTWKLKRLLISPPCVVEEGQALMEVVRVDPPPHIVQTIYASHSMQINAIKIGKDGLIHEGDSLLSYFPAGIRSSHLVHMIMSGKSNKTIKEPLQHFQPQVTDYSATVVAGQPFAIFSQAEADDDRIAIDVVTGPEHAETVLPAGEIDDDCATAKHVGKANFLLTLNSPGTYRIAICVGSVQDGTKILENPTSYILQLDAVTDVPMLSDLRFPGIQLDPPFRSDHFQYMGYVPQGMKQVVIPRSTFKGLGGGIVPKFKWEYSHGQTNSDPRVKGADTGDQRRLGAGDDWHELERRLAEDAPYTLFMPWYDIDDPTLDNKGLGSDRWEVPSKVTLTRGTDPPTTYSIDFKVNVSNKTELADIRSILDATGKKGYGKCDVLDYKDRKFEVEHHLDGNMTKSRPYRCQFDWATGHIGALELEIDDVSCPKCKIKAHDDHQSPEKHFSWSTSETELTDWMVDLRSSSRIKPWFRELDLGEGHLVPFKVIAEDRVSFRMYYVYLQRQCPWYMNAQFSRAFSKAVTTVLWLFIIFGSHQGNQSKLAKYIAFLGSVCTIKSASKLVHDFGQSVGIDDSLAKEMVHSVGQAFNAINMTQFNLNITGSFLDPEYWSDVKDEIVTKLRSVFKAKHNGTHSHGASSSILMAWFKYCEMRWGEGFPTAEAAHAAGQAAIGEAHMDQGKCGVDGCYAAIAGLFGNSTFQTAHGDAINCLPVDSVIDCSAEENRQLCNIILNQAIYEEPETFWGAIHAAEELYQTALELEEGLASFLGMFGFFFMLGICWWFLRYGSGRWTRAQLIPAVIITLLATLALNFFIYHTYNQIVGIASFILVPIIGIIFLLWMVACNKRRPPPPRDGSTPDSEGDTTAETQGCPTVLEALEPYRLWVFVLDIKLVDFARRAMQVKQNMQNYRAAALVKSEGPLTYMCWTAVAYIILHVVSGLIMAYVLTSHRHEVKDSDQAGPVGTCWSKMIATTRNFLINRDMCPGNPTRGHKLTPEHDATATYALRCNRDQKVEQFRESLRREHVLQYDEKLGSWSDTDVKHISINYLDIRLQQLTRILGIVPVVGKLARGVVRKALLNPFLWFTRVKVRECVPVKPAVWHAEDDEVFNPSHKDFSLGKQVEVWVWSPSCCFRNFCCSGSWRRGIVFNEGPLKVVYVEPGDNNTQKCAVRKFENPVERALFPINTLLKPVEPEETGMAVEVKVQGNWNFFTFPPEGPEKKVKGLIVGVEFDDGSINDKISAVRQSPPATRSTAINELETAASQALEKAHIKVGLESDKTSKFDNTVLSNNAIDSNKPADGNDNGNLPTTDIKFSEITEKMKIIEAKSNAALYSNAKQMLAHKVTGWLTRIPKSKEVVKETKPPTTSLSRWFQRQDSGVKKLRKSKTADLLREERKDEVHKLRAKRHLLSHIDAIREKEMALRSYGIVWYDIVKSSDKGYLVPTTKVEAEEPLDELFGLFARSHGMPTEAGEEEKAPDPREKFRSRVAKARLSFIADAVKSRVLMARLLASRQAQGATEGILNEETQTVAESNKREVEEEAEPVVDGTFAFRGHGQTKKSEGPNTTTILDPPLTKATASASLHLKLTSSSTKADWAVGVVLLRAGTTKVTDELLSAFNIQLKAARYRAPGAQGRLKRGAGPEWPKDGQDAQKVVEIRISYQRGGRLSPGFVKVVDPKSRAPAFQFPVKPFDLPDGYEYRFYVTTSRSDQQMEVMSWGCDRTQESRILSNRLEAFTSYFSNSVSNRQAEAAERALRSDETPAAQQQQRSWFSFPAWTRSGQQAAGEADGSWAGAAGTLMSQLYDGLSSAVREAPAQAAKILGAVREETGKATRAVKQMMASFFRAPVRDRFDIFCHRMGLKHTFSEVLTVHNKKRMITTVEGKTMVADQLSGKQLSYYQSWFVNRPEWVKPIDLDTENRVVKHCTNYQWLCFDFWDRPWWPESVSDKEGTWLYDVYQEPNMKVNKPGSWGPQGLWDWGRKKVPVFARKCTDGIVPGDVSDYDKAKMRQWMWKKLLAECWVPLLQLGVLVEDMRGVAEADAKAGREDAVADEFAEGLAQTFAEAHWFYLQVTGQAKSKGPLYLTPKYVDAVVERLEEAEDWKDLTFWMGADRARGGEVVVEFDTTLFRNTELREQLRLLPSASRGSSDGDCCNPMSCFPGANRSYTQIKQDAPSFEATVVLYKFASRLSDELHRFQGNSHRQDVLKALNELQQHFEKGQEWTRDDAHRKMDELQRDVVPKIRAVLGHLNDLEGTASYDYTDIVCDHDPEGMMDVPAVGTKAIEFFGPDGKCVKVVSQVELQHVPIIMRYLDSFAFCTRSASLNSPWTEMFGVMFAGRGHGAEYDWFMNTLCLVTSTMLVEFLKLPASAPEGFEEGFEERRRLAEFNQNAYHVEEGFPEHVPINLWLILIVAVVEMLFVSQEIRRGVSRLALASPMFQCLGIFFLMNPFNENVGNPPQYQPKPFCSWLTILCFMMSLVSAVIVLWVDGGGDSDEREGLSTQFMRTYMEMKTSSAGGLFPRPQGEIALARRFRLRIGGLGILLDGQVSVPPILDAEQQRAQHFLLKKLRFYELRATDWKYSPVQRHSRLKWLSGDVRNSFPIEMAPDHLSGAESMPQVVASIHCLSPLSQVSHKLNPAHDPVLTLTIPKEFEQKKSEQAIIELWRQQIQEWFTSTLGADGGDSLSDLIQAHLEAVITEELLDPTSLERVRIKARVKIQDLPPGFPDVTRNKVYGYVQVLKETERVAQDFPRGRASVIGQFVKEGKEVWLDVPPFEIIANSRGQVSLSIWRIDEAQDELVAMTTLFELESSWGRVEEAIQNDMKGAFQRNLHFEFIKRGGTFAPMEVEPLVTAGSADAVEEEPRWRASWFRSTSLASEEDNSYRNLFTRFLQNASIHNQYDIRDWLVELYGTPVDPKDGVVQVKSWNVMYVVSAIILHLILLACWIVNLIRNEQMPEWIPLSWATGLLIQVLGAHSTWFHVVRRQKCRGATSALFWTAVLVLPLLLFHWLTFGGILINASEMPPGLVPAVQTGNSSYFQEVAQDDVKNDQHALREVEKQKEAAWKQIKTGIHNHSLPVAFGGAVKLVTFIEFDPTHINGHRIEWGRIEWYWYVLLIIYLILELKAVVLMARAIVSLPQDGGQFLDLKYWWRAKRGISEVGKAAVDVVTDPVSSPNTDEAQYYLVQQLRVVKSALKDVRLTDDAVKMDPFLDDSQFIMDTYRLFGASPDCSYGLMRFLDNIEVRLEMEKLIQKCGPNLTTVLKRRGRESPEQADKRMMEVKKVVDKANRVLHARRAEPPQDAQARVSADQAREELKRDLSKHLKEVGVESEVSQEEMKELTRPFARTVLIETRKHLNKMAERLDKKKGELFPREEDEVRLKVIKGHIVWQQERMNIELRRAVINEVQTARHVLVLVQTLLLLVALLFQWSEESMQLNSDPLLDEFFCARTFLLLAIAQVAVLACLVGGYVYGVSHGIQAPERTAMIRRAVYATQAALHILSVLAYLIADWATFAIPGPRLIGFPIVALVIIGCNIFMAAVHIAMFLTTKVDKRKNVTSVGDIIKSWCTTLKEKCCGCCFPSEHKRLDTEDVDVLNAKDKFYALEKELLSGARGHAELIESQAKNAIHYVLLGEHLRPPVGLMGSSKQQRLPHPIVPHPARLGKLPVTLSLDMNSLTVNWASRDTGMVAVRRHLFHAFGDSYEAAWAFITRERAVPISQCIEKLAEVAKANRRTDRRLEVFKEQLADKFQLVWKMTPNAPTIPKPKGQDPEGCLTLQMIGRLYPLDVRQRFNKRLGSKFLRGFNGEKPESGGPDAFFDVARSTKGDALEQGRIKTIIRKDLGYGNIESLWALLSGSLEVELNLDGADIFGTGGYLPDRESLDSLLDSFQQTDPQDRTLQEALKQELDRHWSKSSLKGDGKGGKYTLQQYQLKPKKGGYAEASLEQYMIPLSAITAVRAGEKRLGFGTEDRYKSVQIEVRNMPKGVDPVSDQATQEWEHFKLATESEVGLLAGKSKAWIPGKKVSLEEAKQDQLVFGKGRTMKERGLDINSETMEVHMLGDNHAVWMNVIRECTLDPREVADAGRDAFRVDKKGHQGDRIMSGTLAGKAEDEEDMSEEKAWEELKKVDHAAFCRILPGSWISRTANLTRGCAVMARGNFAQIYKRGDIGVVWEEYKTTEGEERFNIIWLQSWLVSSMTKRLDVWPKHLKYVQTWRLPARPVSSAARIRIAGKLISLAREDWGISFNDLSNEREKMVTTAFVDPQDRGRGGGSILALVASSWEGEIMRNANDRLNASAKIGELQLWPGSIVVVKPGVKVDIFDVTGTPQENLKRATDARAIIVRTEVDHGMAQLHMAWLADEKGVPYDWEFAKQGKSTFIISPADYTRGFVLEHAHDPGTVLNDGEEVKANFKIPDQRTDDLLTGRLSIRTHPKTGRKFFLVSWSGPRGELLEEQVPSHEWMMRCRPGDRSRTKMGFDYNCINPARSEALSSGELQLYKEQNVYLQATLSERYADMPGIADCSFGVKPPLPEGLSLDDTTGDIQGTTVGDSGMQQYKVRAETGDPEVFREFTLKLGVADAPVPDIFRKPAPTPRALMLHMKDGTRFYSHTENLGARDQAGCVFCGGECTCGASACCAPPAQDERVPCCAMCGTKYACSSEAGVAPACKCCPGEAPAGWKTNIGCGVITTNTKRSYGRVDVTDSKPEVRVAHVRGGVSPIPIYAIVKGQIDYLVDEGGSNERKCIYKENAAVGVLAVEAGVRIGAEDQWHFELYDKIPVPDDQNAKPMARGILSNAIPAMNQVISNRNTTTSQIVPIVTKLVDPPSLKGYVVGQNKEHEGLIRARVGWGAKLTINLVSGPDDCRCKFKILRDGALEVEKPVPERPMLGSWEGEEDMKKIALLSGDLYDFLDSQVSFEVFKAVGGSREEVLKYPEGTNTLTMQQLLDLGAKVNTFTLPPSGGEDSITLEVFEGKATPATSSSIPGGPSGVSERGGAGGLRG